MAVTIPPSRPSITEFTLGGPNVFTKVTLPSNRVEAKYSVYATGPVYFCYVGEDEGTRTTEARVPIPGGAWTELDRETSAHLYFACASGGATVHFKAGDK